MSFSDTFHSLKVDSWYKVLIVVSGIALLISLVKDIKGITNGQLQLLSSGFLSIGIGEWKNHKVASWIKPPNAYTGPAALIQAPVRSPDVVGILFDFVGLFLVACGVWQIAKVVLL